VAAACCERGNELSGYVKLGEYLDWPSEEVLCLQCSWLIVSPLICET